MASTSLTPANPSQNLTQANFLQLLVTQMTSQDPLSPQSDTAFAAQLAQFTALQTAQTTQGDVAALQASQLLGSTVTVAAGAGSLTGIVSAVQMNNGTPSIVVGSGAQAQAYDLSAILNIQATVPATASTP